MSEKISGPEEPAPWIRGLYGEYARQISREQPAEALELAERIEDDADRERTLIRIARYWHTQDEEAAEAWLIQSSLSEDARSQARDTRQPINLPGGTNP